MKKFFVKKRPLLQFLIVILMGQDFVLFREGEQI